jgi:D-alanine-D-alanine ligase
LPSSWAVIPANINILISGNLVYHYLDKTKYRGYCVHILKEKWVYVDEAETEYPIDKK